MKDYIMPLEYYISRKMYLKSFFISYGTEKYIFYETEYFLWMQIQIIDKTRKFAIIADSVEIDVLLRIFWQA